MIDERDNPSEPEFGIPPELRRSLRQADEPDFTVPPAVEDAIHAASRRHFRTFRTRRLLRIWIPITGAAAAILLFFVLAEPTSRVAYEPAQPLATVASHADVTILDAFALARRLKAHETPGREWDVNADGVVDQRDVDALARAAVRLENGT
ncbi:MAG: dockerin type I domain-containing protein [Phycisphaerae bacterium]|jgi:hypothetical protein